MSYRIEQLRDYLFDVIDDMLKTKTYQINADMLADTPENFSLDKVPVKSEVDKWIMGIEIHRDVFNFRSRKLYSQDSTNNLSNIDFFEDFERIINSNNKKGILPKIEGIEHIKCLNAGTLDSADTNTAEFSVQIEIQYKEYNKEKIISL